MNPLFVIPLVAAPIVALAQSLPTPDDFGAFLNLFLGSTINVKVALALTAAVWGLRKYAVKEVKFFQTDEGGVVLLSLTSFFLALSTSFYTLHGQMTWQWLAHVTLVAFSAAVISGGTWNLVQAYVRVLAPKAIESTKLAKVPFIGTIVQKVAEYALKLVKSKLEKIAAGEPDAPVPAPVPEPVPVDQTQDPAVDPAIHNLP